MAKKVTIETIRITIGRKTLELTPDELRELRAVLNSTFGRTDAPLVIERPFFREPWPYPRWQPLLCDKGTGGGVGKTLQLTCQRDTVNRLEA